jgi:MATE family multidrug resistance protein
MLRQELKPMLALAGPVVLAEIGWVAMGIVDTMIVGRLGPEAIGAVGIGSMLFMAIAIFGMGLLLGLDTLVSQSYGAEQVAECHRWLTQGVYLGLIVSVPLTGLAWFGIEHLHQWGFSDAVLRLTRPYLSIVTWSLLPLLLYASFRRYLQAMNIVKPITFALVSANVINAVINWILVFGHLGAPAMGTNGSAWATLVSRVYMVAVLLGAIVYHDARHRPSLFSVSWTPDPARLRQLVALGFPAACQVTLEMAVFSAATALAGKLDAVSLAAHQVVLNIASLTFMVPLGVASAGAVRVGQAVGRRDPAGARRSGWTALSLGVLFMASASLTFLVVPGGPLVRRPPDRVHPVLWPSLGRDRPLGGPRHRPDQRRQRTTVGMDEADRDGNSDGDVHWPLTARRCYDRSSPDGVPHWLTRDSAA